MVAQIPALSVSRSVRKRLPAQPAPGRVLAVFARSCLLSFEDGGVLSLVLPEIGDGPLNVVVAAEPGDLGGVEPGERACLSLSRLSLGALEVVLDRACIWEPLPPWSQLRAWAAASLGWHNPLHEMARWQTPNGSLLALLQSISDRPPGGRRPARTVDAVHRGVLQADAALRAGWAGDQDALRVGALQLAGLGGGLTPAGDDFLAGLMLRAWLSHHEPQVLCQVVTGIAAPRTTALSAAFLQAAARGECGAAWHELLSVLPGGTESQLTKAVRSVLAYGHTSGADMLAGFLWGENRGLPEWHGWE